MAKKTTKRVVQRDDTRVVMTGVPREITLSDGSEWCMSPLTDRDFSEVDVWIQQRYIKIARKALSEEEEARLLPGIIREAMTLSMFEPEGAKVLSTVDGMAFFLYVSVRKEHPNVTAEAFLTYMRDPRNIRMVSLMSKELNRPARPTEPA